MEHGLLSKRTRSKRRTKRLRSAKECALNAEALTVGHVYRIVGVFHEWDGSTWRSAGGTVAGEFIGHSSSSRHRLLFKDTDSTIWMLTDPDMLLGMQTARVYHLSIADSQFSR